MNAPKPAPTQAKKTPLAIVQTAEPQPITPPDGPGEWTIAQILTALSRPLPKSVTSSRSQGGKTLTYVPWNQVNKILDKYAPGWSWSITNLTTTRDRIFITGRLTVPTASGDVSREATGSELLKEEKIVYIPNPDQPGKKIPLLDDLGNTVMELKEVAYGDPSSNAESMAFRRAAARFGLGLYLYDK